MHNLRDFQIFRSLGDHVVADIIFDPQGGCSRLKNSHTGSSHQKVMNDDGTVTEYARETRAKGILLWDRSRERHLETDGRLVERLPDETLTWAAMRSISQSISEEEREEIRAAVSASNKHRSSYPRFTASKDAIGCGVITDDNPTPAQQLYQLEYDTWYENTMAPWMVAREQFETELTRLLNWAVPTTPEMMAITGREEVAV